MIIELKKELSKLSGVDFFNPKYRDVFKKYFPNDESTDVENTNEEERLKEVIGEDSYEELTEETSNESENIDETNADVDDNSSDTEENEDVSNIEQNKVEENEETNFSDGSSTADKVESGSEKDEGSKDTETNEDKDKELLETKVELELVKAGVRDDRLESARKLFMDDIKSLNDLDKLKDLIKQYPEWLKDKKNTARPFGMPLDNTDDGLTAEEKRLKAMGINPRD